MPWVYSATVGTLRGLMSQLPAPRAGARSRPRPPRCRCPPWSSGAPGIGWWTSGWPSGPPPAYRDCDAAGAGRMRTRRADGGPGGHRAGDPCAVAARRRCDGAAGDRRRGRPDGQPAPPADHDQAGRAAPVGQHAMATSYRDFASRRAPSTWVGRGARSRGRRIGSPSIRAGRSASRRRCGTTPGHRPSTRLTVGCRRRADRPPLVGRRPLNIRRTRSPVRGRLPAGRTRPTVDSGCDRRSAGAGRASAGSSGPGRVGDGQAAARPGAAPAAGRPTAPARRAAPRPTAGPAAAAADRHPGGSAAETVGAP